MYHHRQTGYVVLGVSAAFAVLFVAFAPPGPAGVAALPLGLVGLVALLFGSLTVTVDRAEVAVAFGPGWVHRRIPLSTVRRCQRVRNRWWYGWGLRLLPNGWLWSVSGLDAVELELTEGGVFRIGTDDPDGLCEAIRRAMART